jgi:hypothetical protein
MQIEKVLRSGRKKYRCEEIICHYEMRAGILLGL